MPSKTQPNRSAAPRARQATTAMLPPAPSTGLSIEETQQFLHTLLTTISDVVIVCGLNGHIEAVNRALLKLTRYREEELLGKQFLELLEEDSLVPQLEAILPGRTSIGCAQDFAMLLRGKDGSPLPVAMNWATRYTADGYEAGYVLIGRPIGELQRAYESMHEIHEGLKHAREQLAHSEKMVFLGRLVAGVAHELNNPISFVLGNAYALQRYSQRLKTYLEAVHQDVDSAEREALRQKFRIDRILEDMDPLLHGTIEGAERTRDIVEGLKYFSAKDNGNTTSFNLSEIIRKAVHWVVRPQETALDVINRLPDHLPVSGNAGQIQQVIINLVQNALDATSGQAAPSLEITAAESDGLVQIAFHDNGPGIPPENLSRLFEPFFTTKPVGKGTGLGLSISYGIVSRHGGELTASNHPHGGAVFMLKLPMAQ